MKEREIVSSASFTRAPERRPKKEANPASLRSAAPSKGRGSRGHSLLPLEGVAQKGRRQDGDNGMKESEEMHLKQAINESTAIPISSERIQACVEKQYPPAKRAG